MPGSEVLRRLQQDSATAAIPVVILSANATPSEIERMLSAGAKNYLTKPFDIDPFLAVIDEFVGLAPEPPQSPKLVVLNGPTRNRLEPRLLRGCAFKKRKRLPTYESTV